MKTSWRERLKSGPLRNLYRVARNAKRRITGEPLSGNAPMEFVPLTNDELKRLQQTFPQFPRLDYSLALNHLDTNTPEGDIAAWEALHSAASKGFESIERLNLFLALILARNGQKEAAVHKVASYQDYEFTDDERAVLHQIRKGEITTHPQTAVLSSPQYALPTYPSHHVSDEPLVSVILPNYNYARYLKERIRSILHQNFVDYEFIYLDDASKDESNEVMRAFSNDPRVTMHCFETNSGKVYQRWNDGAALAKGRWLWFAGADDSAQPQFLETLLRLAAQNPEVAILHCQMATIETAGRLLGMNWCATPDLAQHLSRDYVSPGVDEVSRLTAGCFLSSASAMLIRRDAFEAEGGFDVRLWSAADWHLYAKILHKHDVAYAAEPMALYRAHRTTVTKTTRAAIRGLEDAYCVACIYLLMERDARYSDEMRQIAKERTGARVFDLFADPQIQIPENLRYAAETVYRVVPDKRLLTPNL